MISEEKAKEIDNVDIEIDLLLEAIYKKYGHDFRSYSKAHIKRRVLRRQSLANIGTVSEMIYKVLYDKEFFPILLADLSINVTEMFRDPHFYKTFRNEVIPVLSTYPFFNVWHAGCSTGEEVYSMAILLKEVGLYDRAQIYATDFNETVLQKAKEGIYSIDTVKDYTYNYQQSGGTSSFSEYYVAKYDLAFIEQSLKKRIIFADHNLVTDGIFGEMHVIICRNVLIYFDRGLQNRVIQLFYDSLCHGGILCLGSKETIQYSEHDNLFEIIDGKEKIYRKKYVTD
jgi:chemotaxis protein methyltransferase CheR